MSESLFKFSISIPSLRRGSPDHNKLYCSSDFLRASDVVHINLVPPARLPRKWWPKLFFPIELATLNHRCLYPLYSFTANSFTSILHGECGSHYDHILARRPIANASTTIRAYKRPTDSRKAARTCFADVHTSG